MNREERKTLVALMQQETNDLSIAAKCADIAEQYAKDVNDHILIHFDYLDPNEVLSAQSVVNTINLLIEKFKNA